MPATTNAPATIYFLSAPLRGGGKVTVSREGDEYVIRGGFFAYTMLASETDPKRLDSHLAGYIAETEREMKDGPNWF